MVYSTAKLDCCREKPKAEQYFDSLLVSFPQREQNTAPTVECFYTRLEKSKTGYQCVNQVHHLIFFAAMFLSAGETFYLQQHLFFYLGQHLFYLQQHLFLFAETSFFLFAATFFICIFGVQSLICSWHFLCSDPCGPPHLLYTIFWQERYSFRKHSIKKWVTFHIYTNIHFLIILCSVY